MLLFSQSLDNVTADIAGSTGYEYFNGFAP